MRNILILAVLGLAVISVTAYAQRAIRGEKQAKYLPPSYTVTAVDFAAGTVDIDINGTAHMVQGYIVGGGWIECSTDTGLTNGRDIRFAGDEEGWIGQKFHPANRIASCQFGSDTGGVLTDIVVTRID